LVQLICLIFAGELIFSLPFHTSRFFRPTLISAFELSNTAFGDAFALYGILALLAYFPGGVIADRFQARTLMAVSLLATAAGGLYFSTFPGTRGLCLLYGYWGVSTIFLFWSPMIKATRALGSTHHQGLAFGILDGGRGLVAACLASMAVLFLAKYLPGDVEQLSLEQRQSAMRSVIYFYSSLTAVAAAFVWWLIPNDAADEIRPAGGKPESSWSANRDSRDQHPPSSPWLKSVIRDTSAVLTMPSLWLQAGIIICAYCTFKAIDNYAVFAVEVLQMTEVKAANFVANVSYLRPIAAILAGLAADRLSPSRTISFVFIVLLASYGILAAMEYSATSNFLVIVNLAVTCFCAFALRGIYFSTLEESKVPSQHTGAAVGFISVVGYTPDIFFYSFAGRILDANPGADGFSTYFAVLLGVTSVGLCCSAGLAYLVHRRARRP
jgi:sugar phosphate permease